MNYTFESYLSRIKDANVKKHHMQMAADGEKTLILESKEEYSEYVNYLIESKRINVDKLTLEEQVLLAKDPQMFLEFKGFFGDIKNAISNKLSQVKNTISGGLSRTKAAISARIPKSVKKAWEVTKNITKQIKLKLKLAILKYAQPAIIQFKKIMNNRWVKLLIFVCLKVLFPILSVVKLIMMLIKGDFSITGKVTLAVIDLIEDFTDKKKYAQKIAASEKEAKDALEANSRKFKETKKNLIQTKKNLKKLQSDSFSGHINHGNMFFEFREFINSNLEIYNESEDIYFYNELKENQFPHYAKLAIPTGTERIGYSIKLDGDKINIGVDIKKNAIYGFNTSGDFDKDELQEFLDKVFGKGTKSPTGDFYNWKKGEWKKIFTAIETETVASEKKGGAPRDSEDDTSRRSKKGAPLEADMGDEEDEINLSNVNGSGNGNIRKRQNKFNVDGDNNRINIYGDRDYDDDYDDEYDERDRRNRRGRRNNDQGGIWNHLKTNAATYVSAILIILVLFFLAAHIMTMLSGMQVAQAAADAATQAKLDIISKKVDALKAVAKKAAATNDFSNAKFENVSFNIFGDGNTVGDIYKNAENIVKEVKAPQISPK